MTVLQTRADLTIVAVGGFSSDSGKTTLLCELLRTFPGWEAIKVTRGHYRSCGKDPDACCVSPLLGAAPLVRSGRAETYAPGKDTGRYWDAGASNVHWVIATDGQVEAGIARALRRVETGGVLIEGNSYLRFVAADFALLVARDERQKVKPSARLVLAKASALYLSGVLESGRDESVAAPANFNAQGGLAAGTPIFTPATIPQLVERIREVHTAKCRLRRSVPAVATQT